MKKTISVLIVSIFVLLFSEYVNAQSSGALPFEVLHEKDADLQSQINSVAEETESTQGQVESLSSEVSGTQEEVSGIQSTLSETQALVQELEARIAELEGSVTPPGNNIQSVEFTSSLSQYLSVDDTEQSGLDLSGDMTIELWVNLKTLGSVQGDSVFVAKWNQTDTTNQSYVFQVDSGNKLEFAFRDSSGNFSRAATNGPVLTSTNRWYHAAVVLETAPLHVVFYLDGEEVSPNLTHTGAVSIRDSLAPFTVGARPDGAGLFGPINGKIDELRVWSRARSQEEIVSSMSQQVSANTPNLVGSWKFNSDFSDSSGNSNTLTPVNTPVFSADVPF